MDVGTYGDRKLSRLVDEHRAWRTGVAHSRRVQARADSDREFRRIKAQTTRDGARGNVVSTLGAATSLMKVADVD